MEKILILDFGGPYSRIIARRVRECKVFSQIVSAPVTAEEIEAEKPVGIIVCGPDGSLPQSDEPIIDSRIFELGVPVLGIAFGAQLVCSALGGKISASSEENGVVPLVVDNTCSLFSSLIAKTTCFTNHADGIVQVPTGFRITAKTERCPVAALENASRGIYATQFHPEVDTPQGEQLFKNFLYGICGCHAEWTAAAFVRNSVEEIKEKVGNSKVLLPLSGGVKSGVAAALLHKAIGDRLICLHIDNGLLRKGESEIVNTLFGETEGIPVVTVDAGRRFLGKLIGITEPAAKKKLVAEELARIVSEEAAERGATIGVSLATESKVPQDDTVVAPFCDLYMDEVRAVGVELGLPEAFVYSQHFPMSGLCTRIIGEATEDKLSVVREADAILREEIKSARLRGETDAFFALLTDSRVKTIVLRAVKTDDYGRAKWCHLPYDVLEKAAARIAAVLPEYRVTFDITATDQTEWE
ncbi:MAG: gamma-glutamyl-gamma-aminobutyrate hydrolase family protein [Clostridia bacterium]|nr:gamma-glutamyl-gamma-aminobutyrate hydrolase family protein [Clostridia bacterium]